MTNLQNILTSFLSLSVAQRQPIAKLLPIQIFSVVSAFRRQISSFAFKKCNGVIKPKNLNLNFAYIDFVFSEFKHKGEGEIQN